MNDITPELPAGDPAADSTDPTDPAAETPSPIAAAAPSSRQLPLPAGTRELLPAEDVAIDIRHLSHRFRNHLAVDRVTFQVAPGSLHGFVGPTITIGLE